MSQILSCNKMQSCVVCRWLSCRTRPGSKKRGQESSPSTPSGDSSTASTMPGTPTPDAEPKKKPRKNPKVEEPLTAIQKGRDMANKLLKKKSDAANLALTLQAVPYGEQLHKEMENFSSAFENLGCICTCLHAWHAAWIMSFTPHFPCGFHTCFHDFLSCSWALACSCCFDFGGHVVTSGHMCLCPEEALPQGPCFGGKWEEWGPSCDVMKSFSQRSFQSICLGGVGICCVEQTSLFFTGIWKTCNVSGIVCLIILLYLSNAYILVSSAILPGGGLPSSCQGHAGSEQGFWEATWCRQCNLPTSQ